VLQRLVKKGMSFGRQRYYIELEGSLQGMLQPLVWWGKEDYPILLGLIGG